MDYTTIWTAKRLLVNVTYMYMYISDLLHFILDNYIIV